MRCSSISSTNTLLFLPSVSFVFTLKFQVKATQNVELKTIKSQYGNIHLKSSFLHFQCGGTLSHTHFNISSEEKALQKMPPLPNTETAGVKSERDVVHSESWISMTLSKKTESKETYSNNKNPEIESDSAGNQKSGGGVGMSGSAGGGNGDDGRKDDDNSKKKKDESKDKISRPEGESESDSKKQKENDSKGGSNAKTNRRSGRRAARMQRSLTPIKQPSINSHPSCRRNRHRAQHSSRKDRKKPNKTKKDRRHGRGDESE
jgi:hypothetical protein